MKNTSDALNWLKCKFRYIQNDDYKNVIANPVLWDEALEESLWDNLSQITSSSKELTPRNDMEILSK